jgi:impB/mucB/samB family.
MKYSTRIYEIYLRFVAPENNMVYSIDEVFMDVTSHLGTYSLRLTLGHIERLIISTIRSIKQFECGKLENQ